MFSFPSLLRKTGVAIVVTVAAVAPASAVTFATGSYANSGMGAEFATPYDNLFIDGADARGRAVGAAPVVISLG